MKALFIALLLGCGIQLYASQSSLFCDDEVGLTVEIPAGLHRTWNLSNVQNGFEINMFNSQEDLSPLCAIVFGKYSLENVSNEDFYSIYPSIIQQLQQAFSEEDEDGCEEDVQFQIESLPSLILSENFVSERQRIHFFAEELEGEVCLDVHFFFHNGYICAIATGVYPNVSAERLDRFSSRVVNSIRFIAEAE